MNAPERPIRFRPCLIVAVAAMCAVALAGCGNDKSTAKSAPTGPTFALSEFVLKLNQPTLPAGKFTITADNVGGEEHELVLVRAAAISDLPTKADGSVDEDKIDEADKVGEIDHVAKRSRKSAKFTLTAGTYVAFCNLVDQMGSGGMSGETMMGGGASGHVHFARGMRQLVTVT